MSLSIMSRSLSRPLARFISNGKVLQSRSPAVQVSLAQSLGGIQLAQRGFTRSLWYMCRSDNLATSHKRIAKPCGCCGMHTEGDKELTEFLSTEIKYEKENEKSLDNIEGFTVSKADGAEVTLTRKNEGETVTVRFNVNHSVEDEAPYDVEEQEARGEERLPEPQMVSRPSFIVEVNKGGESTLHVQCSYSSSMEHQGEDDMEESFDDIEIQEVALMKAGEEWGEKQYIVSGANMDGNMYDMVMNLLEERGVDKAFTDQLVDFATAYEHKQYVSFLERFRDFNSK